MESVSNVGVLDKAIGVLHAVEREGPQTLVDLQAATGLPRATLHRLAVALERHGLLRRDQAGRFCLGLGLVALGHVASETFPIAALVAAAARRAVPADRRERAAVRPRRRAPALRRVVSRRPTACAGWSVRARCCRSTSDRPAGCSPASSVRTAGSRPSRSASPASPR